MLGRNRSRRASTLSQLEVREAKTQTQEAIIKHKIEQKKINKTISQFHQAYSSSRS